MKKFICDLFAGEQASPSECILCALLFGAAFFSPVLMWVFL